ncbi:MAG: PHP domain-containing protein [Chloroflexota bacterium]|nr:PHP domain-containing protein [Chloroflexota bacterium]
MTNKGDRLVRVELHVHTRASYDSLLPIEKLLKRCQAIGIDRVAITDHNLIEPAMKAKSLAPDLVIIGEEIETNKGELIGYFMSEWVPPGLDPFETIDRLRAQGAVISVPHPFDTFRSKGWLEEDLEQLAPLVDAVEIFNARCLNNTPNNQAAAFAQEKGLLETVGSDAHSLWEVGRATLRMPDFKDAAEFKAALKNTQQATRLSPPFVHLFSRCAVFYKKLIKLFHCPDVS